MEIIDFLKEYWVLITFCAAEIGIVWAFIRSIIDGIRCTLRNDILDIYDRCKDKQEISRYQLQSIEYSYDVYKKLRGNSFVKDIIEKVKAFKVTD